MRLGDFWMSGPLGLGVGIWQAAMQRRGGPPNVLCDAIARKVCVSAKHDEQLLTLAPHVVYKRSRKEVPTLDAVLFARDGHVVNKASLRTYALEELSDIALTDESFTVLASFEADDPDYAGRTICAVQAV